MLDGKKRFKKIISVMLTAWALVGGSLCIAFCSAVSAYAADAAGTWETRWVGDGDKRMYRYSDGTYAMDRWEDIDGHRYYFDNDGWMKTGWIEYNGEDYYLSRDGIMLTESWIKGTDGKHYYVDENGHKVSGNFYKAWRYESPALDKCWYFFDIDGAMQTQFNHNGEVYYGWILRGNQYWYYLNDFMYEGSSDRRFASINGSIYSFQESSGLMLTGWQQFEGEWYFFDETNGQLRKGWILKDGSLYYAEDSIFTPARAENGGVMTIDGNTYAFGSNGKLLKGWQLMDGYWGYFDTDSGKMYRGWLEYNGHWYYLNYYNYENGVGLIDGKKYCFGNASQGMLTGWQKINGYWYYFAPYGGFDPGSGSYRYTKGEMVKGWLKDNGNWYYLNESMVCGGIYTVNGTKYIFDNSGHLMN